MLGSLPLNISIILFYSFLGFSDKIVGWHFPCFQSCLFCLFSYCHYAEKSVLKRLREEKRQSELDSVWIQVHTYYSSSFQPTMSILYLRLSKSETTSSHYGLYKFSLLSSLHQLFSVHCWKGAMKFKTCMTVCVSITLFSLTLSQSF